MTFPSLWLVIGLYVLLFVIQGVIGARASGRDPLFGRQRNTQSDITSLTSFLFLPAVFFALTGKAVLTYSFVGVLIYMITGVAMWFALNIVGLQKKDRFEQVNALTLAFMTKGGVIAGVGLIFYFMVSVIAFAVIAFLTAQRVDVTSEAGLFWVALWVFAIPTACAFAVNNLVVFLSLWSAETAQQARMQYFAMSMRSYALAAWSVAYPFYAFRQDLFRAEPRWIVLALVLYVLAFLLLVVAPYLVGRTGFNRRSRDVLNKLDDAASKIVVATDPDVSKEYKDHMIRRVLKNLEELVQSVTGGRLFLEYYVKQRGAGPLAALVSGGLEASPAPALPAPEPETPAAQPASGGNPMWDQLLERFGGHMPKWDHRIYVLAQIEEMLAHHGDPGWLRGAAMGARIEIARWLSRRYNRSIILGSLGVLLSPLLPILLQAFSSEFQAMAQAVVRTAQAYGVLPPP